MYAAQHDHVTPPNLQPLHAPNYVQAIDGLSHRLPDDDLPAVLPPLRNIPDNARHRRSSTVSVEHERTRQERLKLERYKVKRDMLRDLLQAGVHPSQIPQFFSNIDKLDKAADAQSTRTTEKSQHAAVDPGSNPTSSAWNYPFPSPTSPSQPIHYHPHHTRTQSYPHTQSALAGLVVDTGARRSFAHDHQHAQHMASYPSPALSTVTNQPTFSTDFFSASPRALQFKFYKPGPKQKVLRRKKANTSTSQTTIHKERSGQRDSRAGSSAASSASPDKNKCSAKNQAPSPRSSKRASLAAEIHFEGDELADDVIMSDIDDDSEDDDDETGSELG